MKVQHTFYAHSDKESNYERFESFCKKGGHDCNPFAAERYAYTGYEIEFTTELDLDTGIVMATHVNGVKLETPVEI